MLAPESPPTKAPAAKSTAAEAVTEPAAKPVAAETTTPKAIVSEPAAAKGLRPTGARAARLLFPVGVRGIGTAHAA